MDKEQKAQNSIQKIKKLLPILLNKYVFVGISFLVFLIFFDKNNLISQFEYRQKLQQLKQTREYYQKEIEINRIEMDELSIGQDSITDAKKLEKLEKFAREKYLMKKDNEEIFVITKD